PSFEIPENFISDSNGRRNIEVCKEDVFAREDENGSDYFRKIKEYAHRFSYTPQNNIRVRSHTWVDEEQPSNGITTDSSLSRAKSISPLSTQKTAGEEKIDRTSLGNETYYTNQPVTIAPDTTVNSNKL